MLRLARKVSSIVLVCVCVCVQVEELRQKLTARERHAKQEAEGWGAANVELKASLAASRQQLEHNRASLGQQVRLDRQGWAVN